MVESRREADAATRALSDDERAYVAAARDVAYTLYEGVRTPPRSCGIALAETFGRARDAIRGWRMFDLPWLHLLSRPEPAPGPISVPPVR